MHVIFQTFVVELWPLIDAKILFPFNILRQMDTISQNFIYAFILQDLHWDCYTSFFAHIYQSYGP